MGSPNPVIGCETSILMRVESVSLEDDSAKDLESQDPVGPALD